jgi:hypothetical protein
MPVFLFVCSYASTLKLFERFTQNFVLEESTFKVVGRMSFVYISVCFARSSNKNLVFPESVHYKKYICIFNLFFYAHIDTQGDHQQFLLR